MGAGSSHFTSDEIETLTSFSSTNPWNYDSDKWLNLFRYKFSLLECTSSQLQTLLGTYCQQVLVNNDKSHNLSTLGAIVYGRLKRSWYFNNSDIELTTSAVLLFRIFCQYIISKSSSSSDKLLTILNTPPVDSSSSSSSSNPGGPVTGKGGDTVNKLPSNYSWGSLFSLCIEFLSTEGISSPETYELHVQVINLVIVLLSTQTCTAYTTHNRLMNTVTKTQVLNNNNNNNSTPLSNENTNSSSSSSSVPAVSLLSQYETTIAAGLEKELTDPYVRISMVLGHDQYTPSERTTKTSGSVSTKSTASSNPPTGPSSSSTTESITRAQVLIRSLLRNVSLDGIRNEDSLSPGSTETYATTKTSLDILQLRNESARQYTKLSNSNGLVSTNGTTTSSSNPSTVSKAVNAIDTFTNFTNNIVSVPVNLVGTFFFDVVEPVGKPLAERSTLLLLLLCHNYRAAEKDKRILPNPYREALKVLTDSRLPSMNYHPLPSLSETFASNKNGSSSTATSTVTPATNGGTVTVSSTTSSSSSSPTGNSAPPPTNLLTMVSFKQLFTSLVSLCETPLGTSLIYTLLQTSDLWNDYLLTRTDIDVLLIPLCQQLYFIYTLGSDHRYVLLITVLLFTQDTRFCETAHRRIRLASSSTAWFRERNQQLDNITLGSLLIICLMRAVSVTSSLSTTDASDSYLHTNAFAALANIAPHAENIHPYAAYKILTTLNSLHLKHKKLANHIDTLTSGTNNGTSPNGSLTSTSSTTVSASTTITTPTTESLADLLQRLTGLLTHYESCIRVGSEALLAMCAPSSLPRNLDLLYTLLHEHQVVDNLANNPDFEIETRCLLSIITHFSSVLRAEERVRALEHAKTGSGGNAEVEVLSKTEVSDSSSDGSSTVNNNNSLFSSIVPWQSVDVLNVLGTAVHKWKGEDHDRAAFIAEDLATQRFSYDEDDEPDVFFVPYVWSLTYNFTKQDICWVPENVKICTTDPTKLYFVMNNNNNTTPATTTPTTDSKHVALHHSGGGHGFESTK